VVEISARYISGGYFDQNEFRITCSDVDERGPLEQICTVDTRDWSVPYAETKILTIVLVASQFGARHAADLVREVGELI
jgi:hypothetical protein